MAGAFGPRPDRRTKDRDELMDLLRDAQQRELLDTDALAMMEGVMRVSETQVRDVMLPRAQMVVLEHDWPLERLIAEIVESGHSRLPVIDESKDNVIGILIVKDLLAHAFDRREDFNPARPAATRQVHPRKQAP